MAQLWRVPLLVVVENNGIAQSTPTALHLAGTIADRARAFGIGHQRVVSADITAIRAQLAHPVAQTRARRSPLVVEFVTHRVGPHSKGDDTRETSVVAEARRQDWYRRYGERFPQQFQPIDRRQRNLIDAVARRVEAQPLCGQEDACSRPSG
jgi:pyruvate dehydrogenase E1 component alpha subunit